MRTLPRSAGTDVAAQCFKRPVARNEGLALSPATAADELSQIHIPLSQTRPSGFQYTISPQPSIISIASRQRSSRPTATVVTPSLSLNCLI